MSHTMLTLLEQPIQLILNNTEMVKQQITNMSRYWWVKKKTLGALPHTDKQTNSSLYHIKLDSIHDQSQFCLFRRGMLRT